MVTREGVPYAPAMCELNVDALRQIRILLRCVQSPVVAYDKDTLTMVKSAVGYCAEIAMQIEALLPMGDELEPGQVHDATWADVRREHLAQFEAMVNALQPEPEAPYTWAEYQAANKQALDEIADFVGGTR